jgi:predicted enzyme related to lactoylglutathione lyase
MAKLLVNLDVADLEQATRFYTEAFGLTVGRRFGPFVTELLGAEAPLYLLKKRAGTPPFAGATSTRTFERHWTPVHLDFAVDEIEPAVARALACGAKQEGETQTHDWGQMALMSDPFGHGFCLIQFTAAGYDAVAT